MGGKARFGGELTGADGAALKTANPLAVLVAIVVGELGSEVAGLRDLATIALGGPVGRTDERTNSRTRGRIRPRGRTLNRTQAERPSAVPHASRCLIQKSIPAPQSPSAGQEPGCGGQPFSE